MHYIILRELILYIKIYDIINYKIRVNICKLICRYVNHININAK